MQVVLITGCSGGIGLQAALAFARAGYRVIATVRDSSRATALREALAAESLEARIETLDVARPDTFAPFVDQLLAREGRLDVLVNNAAVLPVGAAEDLDEAAWRAVMETNFFGPVLLTRAVLPVMRRQRAGCIIMLSSLSGMAARAGDAPYSASKFALEGFTESLRNEVARWNIRTALVHAAHYATSMFRTTAAGGLGYCTPDSPYALLIASQQRGLRETLSEGRDPSELAALLVHIAGADGRRFRWAADALSERVAQTVFAQSDAERQAFLREVAGVGWWVDGDATPAGDVS